LDTERRFAFPGRAPIVQMSAHNNYIEVGT
jgi:hypothetical protein